MLVLTESDAIDCTDGRIGSAGNQPDPWATRSRYVADLSPGSWPEIASKYSSTLTECHRESTL